MTDRVQVLVVDDHPVFRNGLRALLATDPAVFVVGEAATGTEAVPSARIRAFLHGTLGRR
jgi:DNA-binding NarL/FixJ family response regulator